jgi:thymidylate synthase
MIRVKHNVASVREWFLEIKKAEEYVIDKSGCKMLEITGATFIADEPAIFGKVNEDYVNREIEWYENMSRNVHDIPGGAPKEWVRCATSEGLVNSNYGHLVWSEENGLQYENVRRELKDKPESRRAVMIYTRPSMWLDYNTGGMSDFVCTNAVQYLIRGGELVAVVQMRSNDLWAGYRNDRFWQQHVHQKLANDLNIPQGTMIWHVGSLHCYERNFYLIDGYDKTGRYDMTKSEYDLLAK